MTDERLTNQAQSVRAEAERLYVHDPATVRHPSWSEFNRFLKEVLELCRLTDPIDRGNPFLYSAKAMQSDGDVPAPVTGDLVNIVDPTWQHRRIPLPSDIDGPFYFDASTGQWLVFTRFPIPAAHAQRYQSKAAAYPIPEDEA